MSVGKRHSHVTRPFKNFNQRKILQKIIITVEEQHGY